MITTIQVKKETADLLRALRDQSQLDSYDATITSLIENTQSSGISMFGALGKKNMKHILKGLRDEEDRI